MPRKPKSSSTGFVHPKNLRVPLHGSSTEGETGPKIRALCRVHPRRVRQGLRDRGGYSKKTISSWAEIDLYYKNGRW